MAPETSRDWQSLRVFGQVRLQKKRKIGCDWLKVTLEVRKVRKIAGVALSLRSGLKRPVRDFFRKIFGIAPGGVRGGRGQTRQRLRQTRTIHGASSFFQWTPLLEALADAATCRRVFCVPCHDLLLQSVNAYSCTAAADLRVTSVVPQSQHITSFNQATYSST